MLHLRPMLPDEPEMVPEDDTEYVQLHDFKGKPLGEWFHFDPITSLAVKGPKPKKPKMIYTGSMLHVDVTCGDCGRGLQNGNGPGRFMVCGRLEASPPFGFLYDKEVEVETDDGKKVKRIETFRLQDDDPPEPKPDTVIECGRLGLEGKA